MDWIRINDRLARPAWIPLLLACLCLSSCGLMKKDGPFVDTGYVIHTFASPVTQKSRDYAVHIPATYNDNKRKWPVILFLHGLGESGDAIDLVLKHGPLKEAMMRPAFPFIVVAPQCPKRSASETRSAGSGWVYDEADVMLILEEVKSTYRVDEERIYLTGLSMGGFGCFHIAATHPGVFAAVAPICGGGDTAQSNKYVGTPFWIFHGQKDTVVPPSRSVEMYEMMKQLGVDAQLTIYPDAEHDSWTQTYENDELYAWFLQHKLGDKPPTKEAEPVEESS